MAFPRVELLTVLLVLLWSGWPGPWFGRSLVASATAQAGEESPPGQSRGTADSPSVLPAASREAQRRLELARRAIQQERFADAAEQLQGILRAEAEDGFVAPASDGSPQPTVRQEARRLLGSLPAPGRRVYEDLFGAEARSLLRQAIGQGDRDALGRISQNYFHTQSGYQATLLLGRDHLDQGRPWEAIGWLRQLAADGVAAPQCEPDCSLLLAAAWLAVGNQGRAREVLDAMAQRCPGARFRMGDREYTVSRQAGPLLDSLARLVGFEGASRSCRAEQWPIFRGNAARSGEGRFGGQLGAVLWGVDPATEKATLESIRTGQKKLISLKLAPLPAAQPLVVGPWVLLRTSSRLVAVDRDTGKQVWDFADEGPVEPDEASAPGQVRFYFPSSPQLRLYQRAWDDAAYGQLSSDGRRVFLLDRLAPTWGGPRTQAILGGCRPCSQLLGLGGEVSNRLVAFDLQKEGSLAWSVGGRNGLEEPKLSGAFFLGPPLPHGGRLYVLAERRGDLLLCVLRAENGRLEWSRVLAHFDGAAHYDPLRRLAGATPSLADGVVVCPTSAGAVVAVDAATRSLLWGYQCPRAAQPTPGRRAWFIYSDPMDRWMDSSVTIADGRVLLTPVESNQLLCLDLFTGECLWSADRGELLFAGCVDRGEVIVVGTHLVAAFHLAGGKLAWQVELPQGMTSGRGVYSAGYYYLPTTASQLLKIDLAAGRIAGEIPTPGVLGNLVGLEGRLLSQAADGVQMFAADEHSDPQSRDAAR